MNTKIIVIYLLLLFPCETYSQLNKITQGKYIYEVYHEGEAATYFEGRYIGRRELTAATPSYYEKVWSKLYWLHVSFYSGIQSNKKFGKESFEDNQIICIVHWDNGGKSFIEIENYTINVEQITEESISGLTLEGYDRDGRYWELYP